MPQDPNSVPVFLDRIEGDIAIVLCAPDAERVFEWRLPRAALPLDAQPGDRLVCVFARDPGGTAAGKIENSVLRAKLSAPEARE